MKKDLGFRLKLLGTVDYAFKTPAERNKAIKGVKTTFKNMGLNQDDYAIKVKNGRPIKGRNVRVIEARVLGVN